MRTTYPSIIAEHFHDSACCPACHALAAWDRAVLAFRRAYAGLPDRAAEAAQRAQAALTNADYGAPIDPLRVETPFTVAYGY